MMLHAFLAMNCSNFPDNNAMFSTSSGLLNCTARRACWPAVMGGSRPSFCSVRAWSECKSRYLFWAVRFHGKARFLAGSEGGVAAKFLFSPCLVRVRITLLV